MPRLVASVVVLLAALIGPATVHALPHLRDCRTVELGKPRCLPAAASPQLRERATAPVWRAPAGATVAPQPCAAAPDGLCGSIEVALDRADPSRGTTTIGFELYPHTDPTIGVGELLTTNAGGPGVSNTYFRDEWRASFEPVLDRYDLLLIDDRGRGSSDAIDCPATQRGIGDYFAGIAACGAQLGDRAGLYGTAAAADDLDAVRAALGYDTLTFYGVSYGGVDIEAYATRHPEHLRAVVADSPWTSLADALERFEVPALKRDVALSCGRALGCATQNPRPASTLGWLARRLHAAPLTGTGPDLTGASTPVTLDEASLLAYIVENDTAAFAPPAELAAAARALRRGDDAPLLRLAAEQLPSDDPFPFDSGDPAEFSAGAYEATWCADNLELYDMTAPPAVREQQYEDAFARLAPGVVAPFSPSGYGLFLRYFDAGDICVPWPAPTTEVVAPDARYPAVPTLVLSGDLDAVVPSEYTVEYATRWPRHTFVRMAGVGHDALDASACATDIINHFLATHTAGDTSCARVPLPAFATADFPLRTARARPATRAAGDRSNALERRAATVAALTVLDALKRAAMGEPPLTNRGLRGGSFSVTADEETGDLAVALDGDRYAEDLAVTGDATWTGDGELEAHVQVAGAVDGRLDIAGPLLVTTRDRLAVTATLDGRRLRLLVPST